MIRAAKIKAVVFDVGGVLERITGPEELAEQWRSRLGMTSDEFAAAATRVDRDAPPTREE